MPRSRLLGVLLACCAGTAAAAQAPAKGAPPAAPAVSADPAATSASYGDWVLRCEKTAEGARLCEVAQTLQVKEGDRTVPVAQIAFSRSKPGEPLRITVALPANITLPSSAALALGEKDPRPVDLAWRRCLPGTCVAEAQPPAEAVKALLAASEPARLSFTDAAGRPVALPLSLRGLPQALDALNKT